MSNLIIILSIVIAISIGSTIIISFELADVESNRDKLDDMLKRTFYMEYEHDYTGIEIRSLHLYPNIIKVGESTRLSIGLENHENEIKNFFVEVVIQNDPEYWNIEGTLSILPMTYVEYQKGELQIVVTSIDSVGTYLTEIFEIKVYDENMILIDQQNIPIKSTANWEWVN